MLKSSTDIRLYNTNIASKPSFFNGALNTLELDYDPLITGYSLMKWMVLPVWIVKVFPSFASMTEKGLKEFGGISDITLETVGITHGFNANEYHVATGIKKENTEFTNKYQEFSGSPMGNMFKYWVTGIKDPEVGIATYPYIHGMDYAAKNHTGELIYLTTRPDVNNVDRNNIEFACYYTAVMPTKIPLNHFNHTIGTHDQVEFEQTFKGCFHMGEKVEKLAKQVLRERTYGFIEMGEFDPLNPGQGKANANSGYRDSMTIGQNDVMITRGNAK